MTVTKLNESYTAIDADKRTIDEMFEFLRVMKPDVHFNAMSKWKPYIYFSSIQQNKLLVLNGHLSLLGRFGVKPHIETPEYTELEIDQYLADMIDNVLPFEPYDFQMKAFVDSIMNKKQINKMCTGSGKSLTISLIAEFFRRQNKKGLLLVPNINLLTQFKSDIKDYNIIDLYNDTHTIGGGNSDKHFNCSLTISTWQSMQNWHDELDKIDYVITDECLHPETLIKTNEGLKQIQNLKIGDKVLTINEKTKEYEYKPIKKVHKNLMISSKEKMYELILENGNTIKITGNHKVLTKKGWIRTDELTLDDDILDLGDYNVQI